MEELTTIQGITFFISGPEVYVQVNGRFQAISSNPYGQAEAVWSYVNWYHSVPGDERLHYFYNHDYGDVVASEEEKERAEDSIYYLARRYGQMKKDLAEINDLDLDELPMDIQIEHDKTAKMIARYADADIYSKANAREASAKKGYPVLILEKVKSIITSSKNLKEALETLEAYELRLAYYAEAFYAITELGYEVYRNNKPVERARFIKEIS